MRTSYRVTTYPADGCGEPEREIAFGLSIAKAIEVADQGHGSWTDEDGRTCYHASADTGCGGFCIEQE